MPKLALALCALWFFSLFVLRSLIQLRNTGSTGVKGFHGEIGSLPWIAGVSASLGLVCAPLAPIGVLLEWPGGALLAANSPIHAVGASFALLGIGGALVAQLGMGDSWRVGVDEKERTQLVSSGLFAWVRNPIFSFIMLAEVGLLFLVPNVLALFAGILTVLGIELQVRAVEEPHLRNVHGATYAEYSSRVGRFIPGIGLAKSDRPASGAFDNG